MRLWRTWFVPLWSRFDFSHPRGEELLAYLDGQMRGRRRRSLSTHLETCAACRVEMKEIEDGLTSFDTASAEQWSSAPPLPLAEGKALLRRAIHAYQEKRYHQTPAPSFAQTALGRALAAELIIYLGARAAAVVIARIHHERPQQREVMLAIEPPLNGFLGREAAAAVAAKVFHLFNFEGGFTTHPSALPSGEAR